MQNCPSLKKLRWNSFKLRCNFQVHLWFNILTWLGVQKPRSHFCNFSRWIAVTYFSSRKLWCDRRKFQDCLHVWDNNIVTHILTLSMSFREKMKHILHWLIIHTHNFHWIPMKDMSHYSPSVILTNPTTKNLIAALGVLTVFYEPKNLVSVWPAAGVARRKWCHNSEGKPGQGLDRRVCLHNGTCNQGNSNKFE